MQLNSILNKASRIQFERTSVNVPILACFMKMDKTIPKNSSKQFHQNDNNSKNTLQNMQNRTGPAFKNWLILFARDKAGGSAGS